jgi:UDP-N-acetylmuramate dehydrogenase
MTDRRSPWSAPELRDALERALPDLVVESGVPLAPLTTFRIGGPADAYVRVRTPDELVRVVETVRTQGIPHFILGRGANILVGDRGFRGVVIHSQVEGIEVLEGDRVRAGAGVDVWPDLIVSTLGAGLGGLHHFAGIPSSVGGALWQNLHFLSPAPERARTVFIAEVLESAEILTAEGERRVVDVDYFAFGYDDSILHHRADLVLSATFRLERTPEAELRRVVRENLMWRDDRHPDLWLYPSAGSIFQKIEGIGAGRLIEQCGLKGAVHGGAGVFHRHANIIVNLGGGTASEVRALIDRIQETVHRETGYALVPEIGFVGEF